MTVAASETSVRVAGADWHRVREAIRATMHLGWREIRTVIRDPVAFWVNLAMPVLFYFVMVASLEGIAGQAGIANWEAFQLPVAIMIAVQSGGQGFNMVRDIESGYFDKLLLTPTSRLAILIGAMSADFVRVLVQGLIVAAVALITGLTFATGIVGVLLMVLIAGMWGLAYSAVGFAIALKTGSIRALQSVWALFIPFFFLTTSFAPMEALSGWLRAAARVNPMTYLLEGLRSLSMVGWDAGDLGRALLAVAAFGAITLTFAFRALLGRVR